jgi:hypothetical protein
VRLSRPETAVQVAGADVLVIATLALVTAIVRVFVPIFLQHFYAPPLLGFLVFSAVF